MSGVVLRQALLEQLFFHAGAGGTPSQAALVQEAWEECGRAGMDRAVPGEPLTERVPFPGGPYAGYRVLAARQRVGGGIHQAVLFGSHDVLGLSVLLAPDGTAGGEPAWPELERGRPAPGSGGLGTVRVLLGVTGNSLSTPEGVAEVAAALPDLLPGAAPGRWQNEGQRTGQGFAVWEVPPADPVTPSGPVPRRLVVLAPEALERELDAWAWHSRDRLAPLTRYLLHAAKLRYEAAVYDASTHRDLRERVEEATDRARAAGQRLRGRTSTALAEALDARAVLVALRTDAEGLITAAGRLRVMRRTVQIARANLAAAVAGEAAVSLPAAEGSDNPFGHDQRLGQWLEQQLDDDLEYVSATLESSAEVVRDAAALADSHLADHRAQLTLLETSLIGALVMSLTVVQAFGYRVPLPGPLQAPVIALLAAVALILPVAVAGWSRSTVRQGPFRALVQALPAAGGAAGGWFLATLAAEWASGGAQRAGWSVAAAAAGAVAAVAAGLLVQRRLRRVRDLRQGP
ncbi:CATRA conflict system CASPASE/TPR repeat-associated protein [Actinacidiphila acididurans]|uniref:Uncharacterized protein n=1 Tax=Actinacidiphila acididurans TaxID=2784346 RepID=A0ABS2TWV1_9ACTN|nr:CATRA conflict system CASPASE/TPR repeat-associated protein [Actinacidiphila acididurans]MBM9507820.1 hypothetical protein [Actinacidiphila acididurans]